MPGFSLLQGKATPGGQMSVALTAALVSILAHVLTVVWPGTIGWKASHSRLRAQKPCDV